MRLKDKVAVVTGAGRGIGKGLRDTVCTRRGQAYRNVPNGQEGSAVAEEINKAGGTAIYVKADVTREAEVAKLMKKTVDEFGKLDILANNAAHNRDFKPVLETTEENWNTELNVTLRGAFFCCKHALPPMLQQGAGSIVLTASWVGLVGFPSFSAYCAAKGGLIQLCRSLAVDYSPKGVRVNVLCPGGVDTPSFDPYRDNEELMEMMRNLSMLGRLGEPAEIANVALFLASDESSYMTGSVVVVDGGGTARLGSVSELPL